MARQGKIVITSVNNAGAGIQAAAKDLVSLESNAVRVAKGIQQAFTAAAIGATIKKIGSAALDAVQAFGEVERKMIQLRTALGGSEASFERMNGLIADLSKQTLASKGDIQNLVADLAALGATDQEIEKVSKAAVNLSNITGQGLNESMKQIMGTFNGTAGEIGKLIPELRGLTKEQLAAGDAADLINRKFGEISDAMASGVSQQIKNVSDNFGDLKENLGEILRNAFTPMLNGINSVITGWNKAYDAHKRYLDSLNDPVLAAMIKEQNSLKNDLDNYYAQLGKNVGGPNSSRNTQPNPVLERTLKDRIDQLSRRIAEYEASKLNSTPGVSTVSTDLRTGLTGNKTEKPGEIVPIDGFRVLTAYDNLAPGLTEYGNQLEEVAAMMAARELANAPTSGFDGGFDFMPGLKDLLPSIGALVEPFSAMAGPLAQINEILNPMSTILTSMFDTIGPLLTEALEPLTYVLKVVGELLGKMLAPVIKFLGGVIEKVASFFIGMINAVISMINAVLPKKWELDKVKFPGATDPVSSSGGSGGTGASYTGPRVVTFNFYNQGNVVGSGGLEELAMLINSIIKREERYA